MTDLSPSPDTLPSTSVDGSDAPNDPSGRRARRARRRRRRRWAGIVLALIIVGGLVVGGYLFVTTEPAVVNASEEPADAPSSPDVPEGLIGVTKDTPKGPPTEIDNRVFVVGDSVMQAASTYLAEDMPDWSLIVDTKVGRFTDQGVDVTERWRTRGSIGEIAVVGLGNNYNGDEDAFATSIDEMMTTLDGVDHVIWFNVAEFEDAQIEVNRQLEAATARHPNLVIVDWNTWYEAEPDFTGADDLHLTPEGASAMATLLANAVRDVTRAANERPKPGVDDPIMTTKGTMPAGSGPKSSSSKSGSTGSSSTGSSSGSSSRSSSSKSRAKAVTPTTVAPATPPTTAKPSAPATTAPTPTTPAPTAPATTAPAPAPTTPVTP